MILNNNDPGPFNYDLSNVKSKLFKIDQNIREVWTLLQEIKDEMNHAMIAYKAKYGEYASAPSFRNLHIDIGNLQNMIKCIYEFMVDREGITDCNGINKIIKRFDSSRHVDYGKKTK